MDEKRQHDRFKINQLIACTPEGDDFLRAEAIDLSRGGMKCSAAKAVDPMTSVFIMLKMPLRSGQREVTCEGYVSHSVMVEGRCVFGVRFTSLGVDDQRALDDYLAELEASGEKAP